MADCQRRPFAPFKPPAKTARAERAPCADFAYWRSVPLPLLGQNELSFAAVLG
jgi:hypothetical protein